MELSTSPIRVMEPAIVERLRLAFPEETFPIERVAPVMTIAEFQRLTRTTPVIGLAWVGMKPDAQSGRVLAAYMRWRLVLVVKASSSPEARFKGDKRDIGLDAMVDVATALLQGHSFPDIGASRATGAEGVYADGLADAAMVLANVDFEIRYTWSPAPLRLTEPGDFLRLGITWINAESPELEEGDTGVEAPQTIFPQGDAP